MRQLNYITEEELIEIGFEKKHEYINDITLVANSDCRIYNIRMHFYSDDISECRLLLTQYNDTQNPLEVIYGVNCIETILYWINRFKIDYYFNCHQLLQLETYNQETLEELVEKIFETNDNTL